MFSQNNQTNTTVMECAQFILPTAMGVNAPSDDLSEDMEGLRLTFPKVKIPGVSGPFTAASSGSA